MKKLNLFVISGLAMVLILTSFDLAGEKEKPLQNPVKITVIYEHPDDPSAFEDYYKNVHAPLVEKINGVSRIELTKFEDGSTGESPKFYRMAELYFPSVEAMQNTLSSPEGKAAVDDIANFATGGVLVLRGTAEDFVFNK